jgi:nitrate reductase gamma subunit
MTIAVYLVVYAALLIFVGTCVFRAFRYASMPMHLRWELYPVPHEDPARARHGGSYFEQSDWWSHRASFGLWGDLTTMVPEMLFLRGLWEFNRSLWFRSFPFHFGLYLLGCGSLLVGLNAGLSIVAPSLTGGALGSLLEGLYSLAGGAGSVLAIVGALALLHRRLTHDDLKPYTTPGDLFNLLFFVFALGALALGFLLRRAGSPGALALARGLLTLDTRLQIPGLLAAGLVLGSLLVAYIPLTHMSHFIAKYFTYHAIRWDDRPSAADARVRRRIAEQLTYRPTWAAPHVGADGTRTWSDVATTGPGKGTRR